jgi:threonine dehydrogenase-like Zn-dependent dehydrogenase
MANEQPVSDTCGAIRLPKKYYSLILLAVGIFGYSHFTAGFAGGQAEYVRVPEGDVNLLQLPDDVPFEKGLYLSDVLATSYHCVTDTGVDKGDVVAIWGAGPIGQMCAKFSFDQGASRVILIDGGEGAWRLDFVKSKIPKVETLDFTKLPRGESVTSELKKRVHGGPDVALECAAGEYAKGWLHYFETLLGMETDTSEILNEMITSVRPFGRVGVTGVYAGYVSHVVLHDIGKPPRLTTYCRPITSTWVL